MATRAKTAKKAAAKKKPARILLPSGATGDEGTRPKSNKKAPARILLPSGATEDEGTRPKPRKGRG
jgi:hypothetical protein